MAGLGEAIGDRSAAEDEVFQALQLQPWLRIQDKGDRLRTQVGAIHLLRALSTEKVTDAAIEKSQRHQTLRRLLKVWTHPTRLFGQLPPDSARAFNLQALSALEAAVPGGNVELGWLLRGLDDLGRSVSSIAAPAGDVARVFYAEEIEMLAAGLDRARGQKEDV